MCVPVGCTKPVMAVLVYESDGASSWPLWRAISNTKAGSKTMMISFVSDSAEVAEILRVCNHKVSGNRRIHCVVTVKQGSE